MNKEFPAVITQLGKSNAPLSSIVKRGKFQLHAMFNQNGIPFDTFFTDYAPFTFVFEYNGKPYSRDFTKEEIKKLLANAVFYESPRP